jgi:hypothetical protein
MAISGTVVSQLQKISSNEVVVEDMRREAIIYNKRAWRDAVETLTIMQEAALAGLSANFTEAIAPVTIQSMMALFGDASLQFRFVDGMTEPNPIEYHIVFDNDTKILTAPNAIIQHMTLGISDAAPNHADSEYKFWELEEFNSPPLDDEKKYYLYAKVSRTDTTGVFHLSETTINMYSDSGYYYLWVGFLNSAFDGQRTDFVTVNGFTEILPGQITVDRIRDSLARLVIDFQNAKITAQNGAEIVGKITFTDGTTGYPNIADKPDWSEVEAAQSAAQAAATAVGTLNTYVDGAFADGLISEAEAIAIAKYTNSVNTTKSEIESTFAKLYANTYLSGTAKTNLNSSKTALSTAITNLLSAINTAIADGKTTAAEKANVDSKFTAFNSALSTFYAAVEDAKKAIQDYLKTQSEAASSDALSAAEAASNAAAAANAANNTANDKAKVFYATSAPSSGMRTNDLWVNGTDIYRYNGSSWVLASSYDVTKTVINGGLITTGAISFGQTGGMSASGTVRIWSGGTGSSNGQPPGNPTFRVESNGDVYSKGTFYIHDANGNVDGGFSTAGSGSTNVRLWIGGANNGSGPFRVTSDGMVTAKEISMTDAKSNILINGISTPLTGGGEAKFSIYGSIPGTIRFEILLMRYSSESFNRVVPRWLTPWYKHYFPSGTYYPVLWESTTGRIVVDAG